MSRLPNTNFRVTRYEDVMIQEPVHSSLRRNEFADLVDLFVSELPLRMSVIEQMM